VREADNKEMADYILGKLPEADQARLEAEYFADPRLQEQLLLIEDELVDAYVQGRLSTHEKAQLEARFLASPRGQRKLEFASSLARLASEGQSREKQRPRPEQATLPRAASARILAIRRMLAVAGTFVFVLALGWSFREKLFYRSAAQRSRTEGHGIGRPLPPRASDEVSQTSGAEIISVFLKPTSRNVDRVEQANIPVGAQQINIQLVIGAASHNSYRVALVNAADQVKWTGSGLTPRSTPSGKVINLNLPTSLLERGEYTLLLSPNEDGARPIAEYAFVVERTR
jgi:hypothetical protein